ncbi:MAG: cytochrome c-type biogenesis protein [Pseudorhodoplanes sp.]
MYALRLLPVLLLIAVSLLNAAPALAVQPDEILPDAKMEERARHLSRELRCMICQNQSIDDSDAPLARDLRLLVRERLKAGDTDTQVMDFLTARYGDFVLLKPPFNLRTALLWGLPLGILFVGGIVILIAIRRRGLAAPESTPQGIPLTSDEQARIDNLLESDPRTRS